jgi:radical SAM superfamily enzyme YgiQ (UPF0313 family)
MNPKILFINPPFYRFMGEMYDAFPPGCCYAAATLEEAGFTSVIYNAEYDGTRRTLVGNTNHMNTKALIEQHEEYQRRLHDDNDPIWQEIKGRLRKYNPDILIISIFTPTATAGTRIAHMAKEMNPRVITIFEGAFNIGLRSACNPEELGDFAVMDAALRREPDYSAVEVVQRIASGSRDLSGIQGVSWKNENGEIIHNEDRPFIEDINILPMPARHLLEDADKLTPHSFQSIFGSRGCPYKCIFCGCHTSMGYKARLRSAEKLVEEIELVHRNYGVNYFFFCDDIFIIDKERARRFCELLIEKKLNIYFSIQTRAEICDEELFRLIKKAGGQHVAVGVEVGSPEVRKLLNKGNTVEDVRKCAQAVHKAGLYLNAFIMLGLPWEGEEDIRKTVELTREIDPYIVFPYITTPAQGTELATIMQQKNPAGYSEFRDKFYSNLKTDFSELMPPDKREEVLEWALGECNRLNRRSMLKDFFVRPRFYWALAHDFGLFKNPGFVLSYLKELLFVHKK